MYKGLPSRATRRDGKPDTARPERKCRKKKEHGYRQESNTEVLQGRYSPAMAPCRAIETSLQHLVPLQESLERPGTKRLFVGHHFDNARQIGEQITLVVVGQQRWDSSIIKFNLLIVNLDKMNGQVGFD